MLRDRVHHNVRPVAQHYKVANVEARSFLSHAPDITASRRVFPGFSMSGLIEESGGFRQSNEAEEDSISKDQSLSHSEGWITELMNARKPLGAHEL